MPRPTTYRAILVPLDGSAFAEQALPLAVNFARTTRSRLVLATVQHAPLWPDEVTNPDTMAAMRRILHSEGEAYLRSVKQRWDAPGLIMDTVVLPGEPGSVHRVLSSYIQESGIDLVVMATHGRGGVKRAWLGSVADGLVRLAHVPVILSRPGCAQQPGRDRILVPLDGSPLAESVLDEACALAAAGHHEITLLQVVQPVMRTFSPMDIPYTGFDEELTEMRRNAASDYLDDIEERVRAQGLRCTGITLLAPSVADAILDVAKPIHTVLIAMASHGRGGLRRLMLGSVADKIVRAAEVPVLVCRPAGSGSTDRGLPGHAQMAGPRSCAV